MSALDDRKQLRNNILAIVLLLPSADGQVQRMSSYVDVEEGNPTLVLVHWNSDMTSWTSEYLTTRKRLIWTP